MNSDEERNVVRLLAYQWAKGDLPTRRLTYNDYVRAVASLQSITEDPARTAVIVSAVLDQAKEFGCSSEWVQDELKFEAQVEATGDRAHWLNLDVAANDASDESPDLYN
ncbi:hypothetical protein [Spirosoma oryzicola]|uniref:hypothetical protein n=1 Tax=Spirosoma oryzicola TaxID=2898794 RepID=UPI001E4A002E|nr:hypothetical protein [Spirosoma oryzicola]UHG94667.1 hypothetical protein LQ777_29155 [Spirosoma oryzicola]